jgi:hypothetical protein
MKMKRAVVATLISLAFVSQASAVLRPLFPIKPAALFNGELIVLGDDFALRSTKKPLLNHSGPDTVACDWTAAMAFVMRAVPCVSAALSHRSPRARDAASIEAHE